MIILRAVNRLASCTNIEKTLSKQIVTWDEVLALVHYSCEEVAVYVHLWVLWPSIFLIFIVWMNWRTLQPTTFLVGDWNRILGSVQLVSHVLGSRASKRGTVTTEQVQLGIGVRIQLYVGKVLGIPLLVNTCCNNSGVSRMVTWNSPSGVFAVRFSPFVNKSPCHLISAVYFSCLVIFLCYHAFVC